MENPDTPYTDPQGKVGESLQGLESSKKKVYSPYQGIIGTVLGGPLAGVYYLKANFDAMGDHSRSKKTVIWGIILSLFLLLELPFIPEQIPKVIIPATYTCIVSLLIVKMQFTREQIEYSATYSFQSNWKVLGISLLSLFIYVISIYAIFIVYFAIGLIGDV